MSQQRFEKQHQQTLQGFAHMLDVLEKPQLYPDEPRSTRRSFPRAYRSLCQLLALARHRGYSADLRDRLDDMVLRGHRQLYRTPPLQLDVVGFVVRTFPRAVRAEWRLVLASSLLFFGSLAGMDIAVHIKPELIYTVMDPMSVANFESMYDPQTHGAGRTADSDVMMFGFYIYNNIGIAFRTFASGLFAGIGSVLILLFNGIQIGALMGHIDNIGYGETFYPFVIGHGSFELTAIALAGAAGTRLGLSWLLPGARSRTASLQHATQRALPILYGFTGMLLIAAFLEAFWSSSDQISAQIRIGVGAALWAGVFGYFLLAGRGSARAA